MKIMNVFIIQFSNASYHLLLLDSCILSMLMLKKLRKLVDVA
jgi:hypothetical protein